MTTYAQAVIKLVGEENFIGGRVDGPIDKITLTEGTTAPTEKEIQEKLKELKDEYEKQAYARSSSSQYPSITDVVVALAEKEEGDDTMWKEVTALRQKVKSDIPKPT